MQQFDPDKNCDLTPQELAAKLHRLMQSRDTGDSIHFSSADSRTALEIFRSREHYALHFRSLGSNQNGSRIEENHFVGTDGEYLRGNSTCDWESRLVGRSHLIRRLKALETLHHDPDGRNFDHIDRYFKPIKIASDETEPCIAPLTIIPKLDEGFVLATLRATPANIGTSRAVPLHGNEQVEIQDGSKRARFVMQGAGRGMIVTLWEDVHNSSQPQLLASATMRFDQ